MLSQPEAAQSANCGAMVSGVSGKPVGSMDWAGRHWDRRSGKSAPGRKLLDEGPHLLRPQGAIDADAQQGKMRNRVPISLDRLPGKSASAQVGNGEGEHDRHARHFIEEPCQSEERGLGIEGIEHGLDQQQVRAPSNNPRACSSYAATN